MENKTNNKNKISLLKEEKYPDCLSESDISLYSLALMKLEEVCLNTFNQVKHIETKKDFALHDLVKDSYFSSILFYLKKKTQNNELNSDNENALKYYFYYFLDHLPENTKAKLILTTIKNYELLKTFELNLKQNIKIKC